MSFSQRARLPAGTMIDYAIGHLPDLSVPFGRGCECPRIIRLPADWWDSPSAVGCPLTDGPRSSSVARLLTRNTLGAWGWTALAEDAEAIVGELVANAVTHGVIPEHDRKAAPETLGLRLLRRTSTVMCAVLDPGDGLPVVRPPGDGDTAGRGLRIVDGLSDVWGWSPLAGRGKAVWAILFSPDA
jgi:anti-sigma regulatory factor (Ser/Thr protein kinase)